MRDDALENKIKLINLKQDRNLWGRGFYNALWIIEFYIYLFKNNLVRIQKKINKNGG
jgi:hypothetical protein